MRYRPALMLLLIFAAAGAAQDRMADTLRKGVVEEDSKQNLGAAIQDYQAVLAEFSTARQTAATALFRMAECYRKQGNRPQAIAAYQRVVREFADQGKLAEQSKVVLGETYQIAAGERSESQAILSEEEKVQIAKMREARARYRGTIEQEMDVVRAQMSTAERAQKAGVTGEGAIDDLKERLLLLERQLAAFDAGMTSSGVR